jgi:arginyl-tRNA synthetase
MTIEHKIRNLIRKAITEFKLEEFSNSFDVTHPKYLDFGDYSTNLLIIMGPVSVDEEKFIAYLNKHKPKEIEKIDSKARFINFHLSRKFFSGSIEEILNNKDFGNNDSLKDQKIMVEYTDPNPFKPFHIGHLMTNAIGESIARILYHSGANVSRANYQGDVGLHVAKAFYGMEKKGMPEHMDAPVAVLADYIGESYALGSDAYDNDPEAKAKIDIFNKKIYDKSDPEVNQVYDWGFKVTMEAFENIYKTLGTKFDFYFLESDAAPIGEKIVRENIGKVFEISEDAVVFKAEEHDKKLHTRVFITRAGLPTYEAKELGLTTEKFTALPSMNLSIVITANEQADYMRVVEKAISLIYPDLQKKMLHLTHGMLRFAEGKMSSRKGNIVTGESLIRDTIALISEKMKEREWDGEIKNKVAEQVGVSAIKYSILRSKAGSDIIYNVEESISTEGDSGPYLQYSYARAHSVLEKAQKENILPDPHTAAKEISDVTEVEKLLYRFPEVVHRSAQLYEPHHIATYLVELARAFNSFYGNNMIVSKEDEHSSYKVALTYAFSFIMKKGLHLLGIEAPEKM